MTRARARFSFAVMAAASLSCGDAVTVSTTSTESEADSESAATTGPATDPGTTTSDTSSTSGSTGEDTTYELPYGPLRAGAAVGYVASPVGISMAGYGLRTPKVKTPWMDVLNGTRGFYGYTTVKAMVLEVEGERLALVKIPTMSSEDSLTEGTIRKLDELYGLDFEGRLMTGATHSHHTHARYWRLPQQLAVVGADSPDEEVIDRLTSVFAETIKRAVDDLDDAEWGYAYQDDWDVDNHVYRDRRGENNPTYGKDPRLTLFAVRRPGGAPMATLINFGMHGTVFGDDNELLTEDSAGGLEMKFEEYFFRQTGAPILGMFIQSGGGDASPAGDHLGHPGPARIELIGETAAPRVFDLYNTIEWTRDATLAVRSRQIDLTYDGIGYDESDEFKGPSGQPYRWGGWQCKDSDVTDDNNPDTSMEGRPKFCMDMATLLDSFDQPVPNGQMHQTYVTSAVVGDVVMVSLPGEPAYSVIKYLRDQLAERALDGAPVRPLAFGYSQDHLLYLTHPDDWFQGGYEVEMSLWGPLGAKHLVDRQLEIVDGLLRGEAAPVFDRDSEDLAGPSPFEARAFERSLNAGAETIAAPDKIERGQTLRFGWGGGDASISSPRVTVEIDPGNGEWVPYASPSGWPGTALDNTRHHMITHYDPDPAPNGQIAEARAHDWFVDWQLSLDFPGARVRLVARGEFFNGDQVAPYEVTSSEVFVVAPGDVEVTVERVGDVVTLRYVVPPPPYVEDAAYKYPIGGFRLLDATVAPDQPLVVRAPLRVRFTKGGDDVGASYYDAAFDEVQGAHVLDLAGEGLPAGLVAHVHLEADILPSVIDTPVME